jgi:phosphatidylglycerophosphate synthase
VIGAFIFQIALIFDSIDGYVARIKNNGSTFGIILDGYVDFIKIIINSLAIMHSAQYDFYISILFIIFIIINLFDGSLDISIKKCLSFLKNKKIKIYNFEKKLLKIKNSLEERGLRTIFYYTQERYFVVFFLAPIFNQINLFLFINLLITLIFLHIRIMLDIAMIKNQIKNNKNEELKYRDFV